MDACSIVNTIFSPVQWVYNKIRAYPLAIVFLLLIVIAALAWYVLLAKKSTFYVSNNLNWGASPYIDFIKDKSSDDQYSWVEIEKPNLDTLVPEYNFKTSTVDYRFGDHVYDSDSATVDNSSAPVLTTSQLNQKANSVAVIPQVPPPPVTSTVLVPASQSNSPPVIVPSIQTNPPTVMVPVSGPTDNVVVSVPSNAVPPVIVAENNMVSRFSTY
jgi:hypothetical protein